MTRGPCRAGYAICAAAMIGCASGEPQPYLEAVTPSGASSDQDVRLMLIGSGLLPSFRLDPTSSEWVAVMDGFSGRLGVAPQGVAPHWASLTDFGWVGPTQLSATLTTDAATDLWKYADTICPDWREAPDTCLCDIEITDPRGRKATLAKGFAETGPDRKGPALEVDSPAPYCPGATIPVKVKATEQAPRYITALTWRYTEPAAQTGICRFEQGSTEVDCTFDIVISPGLPLDTKPKLEVLASNDANDESSWGITMQLEEPPAVTAVMPQLGGMAGGTNVVIDGSGFLHDSRVYFGDVLLNPNGGIYVDNHTITGYTPAGARAEKVAVTVKSRLGVASLDPGFEYLAPPRIKSIEPNSGVEGEPQSVTVSGSNFRNTTIIYVGSTLGSAQAVAVTWSNSVQIKGSVSGSGGAATVWAIDEVSGWSSLPDGFTWNPP